MKCPVHNEEIRKEYDSKLPSGENYISGFCLKCCQHYLGCMATYYMEPCDLILDHKGQHISERGRKWS